MEKCNWKRARSTKQKEERISEILDASAALFHTKSYDEVSMIMIANKSGFTRSNLYRYFKTKEEIFLELYINDVVLWKESLIVNLVGNESKEEFVDIWIKVLTEQDRLLELMPLLALSLEKNSSEEVYKRIKRKLYLEVVEIRDAVGKIFPKLDASSLFQFLIMQQALVAGLWPMCQYNDMQTNVLSDDDLKIFKLNFITQYKLTLSIYLKGLLL